MFLRARERKSMPRQSRPWFYSYRRRSVRSLWNLGRKTAQVPCCLAWRTFSAMWRSLSERTEPRREFPCRTFCDAEAQRLQPGLSRRGAVQLEVVDEKAVSGLRAEPCAELPEAALVAFHMTEEPGAGDMIELALEERAHEPDADGRAVGEHRDFHAALAQRRDRPEDLGLRTQGPFELLPEEPQGNGLMEMTAHPVQGGRGVPGVAEPLRHVTAEEEDRLLRVQPALFRDLSEGRVEPVVRGRDDIVEVQDEPE